MYLKMYVVTEDLEHLVNEWCQINGYKAPSAAWFALLRKNFQKTLEQFAFPSNDVQIRFIRRNDSIFDTLKKPEDDGSFWISLDRVYVSNADCFIDATRIYNNSHQKLAIAGHPSNSDSLETQIAECHFKWTKTNPSQTILADDGTFTGETIVRVLRLLAARGVDVSGVRLGFCTESSLHETIKPFLKEMLGKMNPVSFSASIIVDETFLLDWVCERDFFIAAPRSGRTIGESKINASGDERVVAFPQNIGLPHLLKWGAIDDGASITKGDLAEISQRLTDYSIRLWQKIAELNPDINFTAGDLPRFPGPESPRAFCEYQECDMVEFLEQREKNHFGTSDRQQMRQSGKWDF